MTVAREYEAMQPMPVIKSIRRIEVESSAVILAVVSKKTNIDDLCDTMNTLVMLQGDPVYLAPVKILYTDDVINPEILLGCTNRNASIHPMQLDFPNGFSPEEGIDYSSERLHRFWTTSIWELDVLQDYEVIMTIDHDACFTIHNKDLPYMKEHQFYHAQLFAGAHEINAKRLPSMYSFVTDYMHEHMLTAKTSGLWNKVHLTIAKNKSIPVFQSTFEVARKSFMLRDEVKSFH